MSKIPDIDDVFGKKSVGLLAKFNKYEEFGLVQVFEVVATVKILVPPICAASEAESPEFCARGQLQFTQVEGVGVPVQ